MAADVELFACAHTAEKLLSRQAIEYSYVYVCIIIRIRVDCIILYIFFSRQWFSSHTQPPAPHFPHSREQ